MENDLSLSLSSYESFKSNLQQGNTREKRDINQLVLNSTEIEKLKLMNDDDHSKGRESSDNTLQDLPLDLSVKSSHKSKRTSKATTEKKERAQPSEKLFLYTCQECGKSFQQIEYFRVHLMKHLVANNDDDRLPPYVCRHGTCQRKFASRNERKAHEKRHITLKNFNCERIREVFRDGNSKK